MPYINQEARRELNDKIDDLAGLIFTYGELNYAITRILHVYELGGLRDYASYNAIIGVLECVKQELYRTEIVPYEEQKRAENGGIFDDEGERSRPAAEGVDSPQSFEGTFAAGRWTLREIEGGTAR